MNFETLMKKLISYTLYTLFCGFIFYYITIPNIIERRARDLGLMTYKASEDRMVAKDSLRISDADLHYLKKGTMKDYRSN